MNGRPEQPWVTVRCLFDVGLDASGDAHTYEERITLWRAPDLDAAIRLAEAEADEYAASVGSSYLGVAQAYQLSEEPEHGGELFSLMRDSALPPNAYVDAFFDTGSERQDRTS